MREKRKPALEVILADLEKLFQESADLDKKMEECRVQFGDDVPYHSEFNRNAVQILQLFTLLRRIQFPQEGILKVVEKLKLLHSKTDKFGVLFEEIIKEFS
ncbi:MAG: hypothetical protein A2Y67_03570 [Candidatus Buchananbacteria bacterium RBG_13_39_9]|uniref:Uncharacterized protein n=1 Tax=Candidatus Buchananbacteria bacterium RBG_13_39_9 TaxID=1797531 RepID=A0A1G1XS61_9BACT|nr:MAG: hypothetical protein A2Y67_03570 [Candidatus Buchananbacteria bacterium RBG_13_39_9]